MQNQQKTYSLKITQQKNSKKSDAQIFSEMCRSLGFIGFSFPKIYTIEKDGQPKKAMDGIPKWKEIDTTNYHENIKEFHSAFVPLEQGEWVALL